MIYLKDSKITVRGSRQVAKVFLDLLRTEDVIDQAKEHFYVMHLDTRSRVNMVELVTLGILTSSVVHPRETFRRAVMQGSASIIVAHNHPSGEPDPSAEDLKVTKVLLTPVKSSALTCWITSFSVLMPSSVFEMIELRRWRGEVRMHE